VEKGEEGKKGCSFSPPTQRRKKGRKEKEIIFPLLPPVDQGNRRKGKKKRKGRRGGKGRRRTRAHRFVSWRVIEVGVGEEREKKKVAPESSCASPKKKGPRKKDKRKKKKGGKWDVDRRPLSSEDELGKDGKKLKGKKIGKKKEWYSARSLRASPKLFA